MLVTVAAAVALVAAVAPHRPHRPGPSVPCDRSRTVVRASEGTIADGPPGANYTQDSFCEWLIVAPDDSPFVTLSFRSMATECSYDYVFVHDGDSYDSPLLGSFSGRNLPSRVTARRGRMLVLLYSDTNYALEGFEADFRAHPCPDACGGRGECVGGTCRCRPGAGGDDCSVELCPDACGGHGVCDGARCVCEPGFSGASCSLGPRSARRSARWHSLSGAASGSGPRAAHSAVYVEEDDSLYAFGGYDLVRVRGDLRVYRFASGLWEDGPGGGPSARYGHAACRVRAGFALHGGQLEDGRLSDELWTYDVRSRAWRLWAPPGDRPPALARHTLTPVEDEIYLFGGSTSDGDFSSRTFKISPGADGRWEEVSVRGGKPSDLRAVAHTTVYHPPSRSLLVYGGVVAGAARFSKLSDRMFSLDLTERHWAEIHYPRRDSHAPRERAFHTADVVGDYLVVFGGYSHRHNKEEICYDNRMYLYHLGCHTWVSGEILGGPADGDAPRRGLFAHASAVRPPSTLLIFGGYHGDVDGDLLAHEFPARFDEGAEASCAGHPSRSECSADPECGWCSADQVCYGRTAGSECTTNLQSVRCGGICPALGDCRACAVHGASAEPRRCSWCVQNARCHRADDDYGVCGEDTPSRVPGWWGPTGDEVTRPDGCRTLDRRPGLTFAEYRHPVDPERPDSVASVESSAVDFDPGGGDDRDRGETVAELRGFVRTPPGRSGGETLRVCAGDARAELYLGRRRLIANVSARESSLCGDAEWPAAVDGRTPVTFRGRASPSSGPRVRRRRSKIELQHAGGGERARVFTSEYLEPFGEGPCDRYRNCLHCLTDSLCGWCERTEECLSRDVDETLRCSDGVHWRYLTLVPSSCPNCSDHVGCPSCVSDGGCEWSPEDARCGRRGRVAGGVRTRADCPSPCRARKDCSSCLDERGRCVWCETTERCFGFSVYTSEYQFGLCREWLDRTAPPDPADAPARHCKSCALHLDCGPCLRSLGCGWCRSRGDPLRGVCVRGDFRSPRSGDCGAALGVPPDDALWAYDRCPDVDECLLGLHDCHRDAACTNTHGSYVCECRRGFVGDGRASCARTCYHECRHGHCLGAPDYLCRCDLGWTGEDCSLDCRCNNHSTCTKGIGLCDECRDWTEGESCERCRTGSYGSAVSSRGCRRCDCNGHGDAALGVCDADTGRCRCEDHTVGDDCGRCDDDHYGDPRRGGACYSGCRSRTLLTGARGQGLGSYDSRPPPRGGSPVEECLWIVSAGDAVPDGLLRLTFESDRLNVTCHENAVYVYDGPAGPERSRLLGVFCGDDSPGWVETASGNLTVYYRRDGSGRGFQAVYDVLSCETGCSDGHVCEERRCVCPDGFAGLRCETELCPGECGASLGRGSCDGDYGRCVCDPAWGGRDCSERIVPGRVVFAELFDSRRLADRVEHLRNTLPRFGHSLDADRRGSLWMFGGYSPSHGPLNDVRLFDTKNNSWMQVTVEAYPDAEMPGRRFFHAAEMVHSRQSLYVYGGFGFGRAGDSHETLADFWHFDLKERRWNDVPGDRTPPPLAGHTLTLRKRRDAESLVLVGGFSFERGHLNDVWEYDLVRAEWTASRTEGARPAGIFGHSAVYRPDSETLYVFGGRVYSVNESSASDRLYSLRLSTMTWYAIPAGGHPRDSPLPRFLHSAVTADGYMVVFGGRTRPANRDVLTAYVYGCDRWVRLDRDVGVGVVGEPPSDTYAHAMTVDAESGAIYIAGGWEGVARFRVVKMILPEDLCELWSADRRDCLGRSGCDFCVSDATRENSTRCVSHDRADSCRGTLVTGELSVCREVPAAREPCRNFTTCDSCLSSWPVDRNGSELCHWCTVCGAGKCVDRDRECPDWPVVCYRDSVKRYTDAVSCPNECSAADCHNCNRDRCVWIKRFSSPADGDGSKTHWSCVSKLDFLRMTVRDVSDPERCPPRCHTFHDCRSCLESQGSEGGARGCHWATHLNRCLSPIFQPLYCTGGVCGSVLRTGQIDRCPSPCSELSRCEKCLRHTHCGWCSPENGDGTGICTRGSSQGPGNDSECESAFGAHVWNFIRCPPENECANGHHDCDPVSERCEDLLRGYKCVCGSGHRDSGGTCVPDCRQGCVRGSCVKPDTCECEFGYVGANCTVQCQCNGHSDCEGPDRLDRCIQCLNNTMGARCDRCKPFYVGDPVNDGACTPCRVYCHGHSEICLGDFADIPHVTVNVTALRLDASSWEGSATKAKCSHCSNNTQGPRCDRCVSGYFRGSDDLRSPCRPCECHGHGDVCDPVTGEKCNCGNNTESDTACQTSSLSKNSAQECWRYQCVKCRDSFMGDPKQGHQCYKMMTADNRMCFDGKLIDECKIKPKMLPAGQTVYFVVIPRFMNVDIRVIIDVTQGALDVFMSPNDSAFVVSVNATTTTHYINLDPSFLKHDSVHTFDTLFDGNSSSKTFRHRSFDGVVDYNLIKRRAENLNTYVTVDKKNTLLWVQGLKNRLVLTLPQVVHDLGYTKFYLILRGVYNVEQSSGSARGIVFFRQDQLHIDLFVFFSVFFSCFFLFLAACVVIWKAKQAADIRRARHRHVVEMLTMAKRPFAAVALFLDLEPSSVPRKNTKSKRSAVVDVRPVAIEPTEDGLAAITTVFVKLPGGKSAPARLALASSLVYLARQMPNSNKTFLRRRSAHNVPSPPL